MSNMWTSALRTIWEPLRGPCSREDVAFLQASQWDSPEVIRHRQLYDLKNLLEFAYANVAHYRQAWNALGFHPNDFRDFSDLKALPILSKADVRSKAISAALIEQPIHRKRTSGSTGSPLEIFVDSRAMAFKHAVTRRANEWSGWRLGEPVAKLWGIPDYRKQGWKARIRNRLIDRAIHLNTVDLTPVKMLDFLRQWNHHAPALLFGHAHSLFLLARFAQQRGFKPRPARGIISSAMPLHAWERVIIQEVFQHRVTDRYGCEETSLIACECAMGTRHIAAESVYVEIEKGRVLLTDLKNRAMPLIRYEIGDRAEVEERSCPCGRGLPLLKKIEGREADFISTPDGRLLSGISLTENFILHLSEVEAVRIDQLELNRIRVRLVPTQMANTQNISATVKRLALELFDSEMRIEIEFVPAIPAEANGKFRFCVSHLDKKTIRSLAA